MQRKFLEDLGIEKEIIDRVMKAHGDATETLKTERDNYKTQLATATTTLKSFEGVNISELQGKITQLTNDLAQKDEVYAAKEAQKLFISKVEKKLSQAGIKDDNAKKAALSLLKIDELEKSKNQDADIDSAILNQKKEISYLYGANVSPVVASTPGLGDKGTPDNKARANEALRSLLRKE